MRIAIVGGQAEMFDATINSTDIQKYAPYLSAETNQNKLTGLLENAISLIEGLKGANRPLQLHQIWDEIETFRRTGDFFLSYWPITNFVEVKGSQGSYEYKILSDTTDYLIDIEYGSLTMAQKWKKIKISYIAGFDFSQDTKDVRFIKGMIGNLMTYLFSRNKFSIDKEAELVNATIVGESSVEYSQVSWISKMPLGEILEPMKKYKPRESPTLV